MKAASGGRLGGREEGSSILLTREHAGNSSPFGQGREDISGEGFDSFQYFGQETFSKIGLGQRVDARSWPIQRALPLSFPNNEH